MEVDSDKVMCRTCLSLNDKNNTLIIYTISDLIMLCSSIKILADDGLPPHICNICQVKARNAQEFRILCEKSDTELRSRLSQTSAAETNITFDEQVECLDFQLRTGGPNDKITTIPQVTPESDVLHSDDENQVDVKAENLESKLYPFNCKYCGMPFLYKKRLEKHEHEHATKGLNCYLCNKIFSSRRQLTLHIGMHKRKGSHLCQTCGKQFTMPENLLRHQRIHSGERRYKCDICRKAFVQSSELKSHIVTHTLDKPFLCSFCGNKFSRKVSLRVHIRRIHSNSGQSHDCDLCGRSFKDKRDLEQHKFIHTGERKHICKICDKAFNRKSNLKVHERIHNGQKPHVCLVCQRGFIQKHVLNTHIQRTHHVDKFNVIKRI